MATTKLWPVRDSVKRDLDYTKNPEKTEYSELSKVLHYAENDTKTFSGDEKVFFVTGIHCSREHAFEEMLAVQEQFGKVDKNLCYHGYQSFKPGEVTPQQCHDIGIKLAEQLWGNRYQVFVATHLNTGHLHNHFVICSVSCREGKKFEAKYWRYRQMRKASDALCRSMGLSVIEKLKAKHPEIYTLPRKEVNLQYTISCVKRLIMLLKFPAQERILKRLYGNRAILLTMIPTAYTLLSVELPMQNRSGSISLERNMIYQKSMND